jgi:hypothetical protein
VTTGIDNLSSRIADVVQANEALAEAMARRIVGELLWSELPEAGRADYLNCARDLIRMVREAQ